jgi:hypothetical protein
MDLWITDKTRTVISKLYHGLEAHCTNEWDCAYRTVIISLHYAFLNESVGIILLKTVDSLMCIWDCSFVHNLIDECALMEGMEY